MKKAVIDANILIDLSVAGILKQFFMLDYDVISTKFVSKEVDQCVHKDIPHGKLRFHDLTQHEEQDVSALQQQFAFLSIADCSVLLLAKSLGSNAFLLTGDKRLRTVTEEQGVVVYGILWVLDNLVNQAWITKQQACCAMLKMKKFGSRLPADECTKREQLWSDKNG